VNELHMAVHDLEQQLKVACGLTVAATAACAANKPAYVPRTNPVSKVSTLSQPPTASMQPTDRQSYPAAPDKGKDKEWPPTPYTDLYSELMAYNDDEYASDYKRNAADKAKARDSLAYCQMTALLSGTSLSIPNASGSSFVEGRVVDIHLQNIAEFTMMCNALEDAHKHNNTHMEDLLQVLHRLVTRCHRAPKKTDLQKSVIERWRAPEWAEALQYDPHTKTIVSTGMTKGKLNNQRTTSGKKLSTKSIGSTEHSQLQLKLARQLNLVVNGRPHARLSSP
jgi:hypothetical protein